MPEISSAWVAGAGLIVAALVFFVFRRYDRTSRGSLLATILVLIFLPMLFDKPALEPTPVMESELPPASQQPVTVIDVDFQNWEFAAEIDRIRAEGGQDLLQPFQFTAEDPDDTGPIGRDANGLPKLWSLLAPQLFIEEKRARALRDLLQVQGHAAYMVSLEGSQGPIYQVAIGPFINRLHAERSRAGLLEEHLINTALYRLKLWEP